MYLHICYIFIKNFPLRFPLDMCTASMKKDRKYKDCTEILDKTETKLKSGVFKIHPDETKSVQVYCDMTTDRGGWTLYVD